MINIYSVRPQLITCNPGDDSDLEDIHIAQIELNRLKITELSLGKSDVGHNHDNLYQSVVEKGAADGYAPLNGSAKIDASFLPSYVDDVLEFADLASFPDPGETGKIYIAIDTNSIYRWSGSSYVAVSSGESVAWVSITGKPTTIAGYGITDFNSLGDARWLGIADKAADSNLLDGVDGNLYQRRYYDLSQIGIAKGSETMDSIFAALPTNSEIIYSVEDNSFNTGIYAVSRGVVRITKSDNYGFATCQARDGDGYYEGRYSSSGNFVSWKELAKMNTTNSGDFTVTGNLSANNFYTPIDGYVYSFEGGAFGQVRAGLRLRGSNHSIEFLTNQTVRGSIDGSGNMVINGTVTAKGVTSFKGVGTGSGNSNITLLGFYESDGSTRQGWIGFGSGSHSDLQISSDINGKSLKIEAGGNLSYNGSIHAVSFFESSDKKLKTKIKKVSASIFSFEFKSEPGVKRYGAIAQETEKTNPELVSTSDDGFKSVNMIDFLSLKFADMENTIQSQEKRIQNLEGAIEKLLKSF